MIEVVIPKRTESQDSSILLNSILLTDIIHISFTSGAY